MPEKDETLIFGASYGSLLATKMLLAGYSVTLVCLPEEAAAINREGTRVRLPVRGRDQLVEVDSRQTPGRLSATTTKAVDPAAFGLVALAMQEPQYRSPGVRELLERVAATGRPCMSIMNMPPPALPRAHTGTFDRDIHPLLYRPECLGKIRSGSDDPSKP